MDDYLDKVKRLRELLGHKADKGPQTPNTGIFHAGPHKPLDDPEARDSELIGPVFKTPNRLKGMKWGEVLLLETDGFLTADEKEWLSCKSPPGMRGMPNLKAVLRRGTMENKTKLPL